MVEKILIISTNVGSLFDDKEKIYNSWFQALIEHIKDKNPLLIILNIQEFGGKNSVPQKATEEFLYDIYKKFKNEYPLYFSFVDTDLNPDQFTALCTIFMIKENFYPVETFNFKENEFFVIKTGFNVERLSFENQPSLKIKFDINLFPNKKWSRKGYLINRIRLDKNHVFDVVNLHLIHDANFCAIISQPQTYQKYRSFQLKSILDKLDEIKSSRSILCGDFNFRTSFMDVCKNVDPKCIVEQHKSLSSADTNFFIKQHNKEKTIAAISEKDMTLTPDIMPLDDERLARHKKFDLELSLFGQEFVEAPVNFKPTYCFLTDSEPLDYNNRRFPSWCDRILFRGDFLPIIKQNLIHLKYDSFGNGLVVGDHKPISLEIPLDLVKNNENVD